MSKERDKLSELSVEPHTQEVDELRSEALANIDSLLGAGTDVWTNFWGSTTKFKRKLDVIMDLATGADIEEKMRKAALSLIRATQEVGLLEQIMSAARDCATLTVEL